LVVVYHARLPVPGGFIGVDVFFVISGFVITRMLLDRVSRAGEYRLRDFYQRRISRLLPALALVIATTALLSTLLGSPFNGQQRETALTGFGAILLSANAVIFLTSGGYFATPPEANPLLNTWSLSVEEQFYLVFPAIIVLVTWWCLKRGIANAKPLAWVIGCLASLSFLWCLALTFGYLGGPLSDPRSFAFLASPTRAWEFAAGALVALLVKPESRSSSRLPYQASAVLGAVLLVASAFLISDASAFPGWIALLPVSATCLILIAGSQSNWLSNGLLSSRPLTAVGDLSYSWYLWHWPFISLALLLWPTQTWVAPLAAIISLPIAWISFHAVENPIRFSARFTGSRSLLLVLGAFLVVAIPCALLLVGSRTFWGSSAITSMNAQVSPVHAWISRGCNSAEPLGTRPDSCVWNQGASELPIYLVGDSQAGQLGEGLMDAASLHGAPMYFGTKGSCPFADLYVALDRVTDRECRSFVSANLKYLEQQRPGTVMIGNWMGYLWLESISLSLDDQSYTTTPASKKALYAEGLTRAIARLTAAGHRVILTQAIASYPDAGATADFWFPYQCSTIQALVDITNCGESRPAASIEAQLLPYDDMQDRVAKSTGAETFDYREALCSGSTCSTNSGNSWIYQDGDHITVDTSRRLSSRLANVLGNWP
jgi:peptidoglycan/LPS O-acetylase OafA/YrhL